MTNNETRRRYAMKVAAFDQECARLRDEKEAIVKEIESLRRERHAALRAMTMAEINWRLQESGNGLQSLVISEKWRVILERWHQEVLDELQRRKDCE